MTFEHDDSYVSGVNIKVIGVGGGGNNAVNRMISSGIKGVEFVAVNTDKQVLDASDAPTHLVIGEKLTNGFGAGADPQIGARAAEEAIEDIKSLLTGTDMVFITAGMGGGTGTGAAPVVARIAQEMDILTIGIVTKPFRFEGPLRMKKAVAGISELSKYVDSLVVIPNERLKQVSDTRITLDNAFEMADSVLAGGTQSISDLINVKGFINLDFADVSSVMKNAGYAHMGMGSATGKDKAEMAAKAAISSPLLESSISGANGILINISGSPDIGLEDVDVAANLITAEAAEDANIIYGVHFDREMEDEMRITIIATGFENHCNDVPKPEAPAKEAAPKLTVNRAPAAPARPAPARRPEVKPSRSVMDELDDMMDDVSPKSSATKKTSR